MEYSAGTVSRVAAKEVVVREYDEKAKKMKDVAYKLDPAAKLVNLESLEDLSSGMAVEVAFVTRKGQRVAKELILKDAEEEPTDKDLAKEEKTDEVESENGAGDFNGNGE